MTLRRLNPAPTSSWDLGLGDDIERLPDCDHEWAGWQPGDDWDPGLGDEPYWDDGEPEDRARGG